MHNVILQPTGNKVAKLNFQSTMRNGIEFGRIKTFYSKRMQIIYPKFNPCLRENSKSTEDKERGKDSKRRYNSLFSE